MSDDTKLAVQGGGKDLFQVFRPQNLTEALAMAKMISESDLVPKDFKNKPGNILVAWSKGAEIGISPMQALESVAVINGRASVYGDVGKALLISNGCEIEEDDIEAIRKNQIARCTVSRPGRKPVTRSFSVEDAKMAKLWNKDGPWQQYPYRQMAWRAFWYAARDAAGDILKGMAGKEEVEDYDNPEPKNITPKPERASAAVTVTPESATPAAEPAPAVEPAMEPKQEPTPTTTAPAVEQTTPADPGALIKISAEDRNSFIAAMNANGWPQDEVKKILMSYGFATTRDITVAGYDEIMKVVSRPFKK